ncbi:hypothetical protein HDU78_006988 [Chytriomyces hyalinus]|nr:hypothetical protein HDU78_006988 [Chytriomyces hyalinus]
MHSTNPTNEDWHQLSMGIALNAAVIDDDATEVPQADNPQSSMDAHTPQHNGDAASQQNSGSNDNAWVPIDSNDAAAAIVSSVSQVTHSTESHTENSTAPSEVPSTSSPIAVPEYRASVSFSLGSLISNLDLFTAQYEGLSPFHENTSFLETPVLCGTNISDALDRIASYDTGRLLTVPRSHFNLSQPYPKITSFNPEQAISNAILDTKYFYECGADLKRDFRFTKPEDCLNNNKFSSNHPIPKYIRHNLAYAQLSVKTLMKSWITYSNEKSIVWWASHGELLGWAWNGMLMPWDLDWDLQMTTYQLVQLAAHNGTLIDERFLIDVNPSIYVRTRQPNNVIDARIIDTWTGYFVDITGVSFLDRELMNQDFRNQTFAWNQEEESRLSEESDPIRGYCKSIHRYSYEELMPLHETVLEGLKVWRPRKIMQLLVREYSIDALLKEKYENGHRGEIYGWNNGTSVWDLVEVKGEFDPVQTETSAAATSDALETATVETATVEAVSVEAPTSTSEDNAIETWEFVGEK